MIHISRVAVYAQGCYVLDIAEGHYPLPLPWREEPAQSFERTTILWMCGSGLVTLLFWPIVNVAVSSLVRPIWVYRGLRSDLELCCDRVSDALTKGSHYVTTVEAEETFKSVLAKLDIVMRSTTPVWYEALLIRQEPIYWYIRLVSRHLKRLVSTYNFFQRMYLQACQVTDGSHSNPDSRPDHTLMVELMDSYDEFIAIAARLATHFKKGFEYTGENNMLLGWTDEWERGLLDICRRLVHRRAVIRRTHITNMRAWDQISAVMGDYKYIPTISETSVDEAAKGMTARMTTKTEFNALYALLYVGSTVPEDLCDLIIRIRERKRICGIKGQRTDVNNTVTSTPRGLSSQSWQNISPVSSPRHPAHTPRSLSNNGHVERASSAGMLLSRDSRVDMEMRQYKTQAFVDSLQSTSTDNRSPPNTNTSADTVQLNGSTQEEPSTHSHSHSHPHSHPHPHPQPHPHPHPQRELELESVSKEQAGTGTSVSASGNTVTLSGEERQPHTTDYCGTQNKGAGVETVRNTPGSINQVLKACSINEVEKEQATTATGKHVTYRQPSANESYATDGMSDDIECEGPPASEPSADRCVQAKSGPEDPNLGYRRTGKRLMYVKESDMSARSSGDSLESSEPDYAATDTDPKSALGQGSEIGPNDLTHPNTPDGTAEATVVSERAGDSQANAESTRALDPAHAPQDMHLETGHRAEGAANGQIDQQQHTRTDHEERLKGSVDGDAGGAPSDRGVDIPTHGMSTGLPTHGMSTELPTHGMSTGLPTHVPDTVGSAGQAQGLRTRSCRRGRSPTDDRCKQKQTTPLLTDGETACTHPHPQKEPGQGKGRETGPDTDADAGASASAFAGGVPIKGAGAQDQGRQDKHSDGVVFTDSLLMDQTFRAARARNSSLSFHQKFRQKAGISRVYKQWASVYRRYNHKTFFYSLRMTLLIVPFMALYFVDAGDIALLQNLHRNGTYYTVLMSISSLASIEHIVLGASFVKGQNRLVGQVMGCLIALVVNMTVYDNPYALLFLWAVVSYAAVYMFDFAALPAAQLYLGSGFLSCAMRLTTEPAPMVTVTYMTMSVIGCVVSILAAVFFFPNRATDAVMEEVADDMEVCADYILKLVNCVVRGDDLIKGLRHIGEVELYERLSNVLELSKLAADEPRVPMAKPHDEQLTASLKELVTEITMASVRMAGAVRYMASKPAKSHERYTRPLATPMLEVAHQCSALLRSYSTALREGQLIAKKDASLSKRQGDLDEGPLQSAYRALRAYHKQSSSNNLLALENELLDEHWVHPATLAFMLNLESIVEMVSAIDSFRIQ